MYKLYINDAFIINVSGFSEFINKDTSVDKDDINDEYNLTFAIGVNEDILPENFQLTQFIDYMKENSIQKIEIKKEDKVLFFSTNYSLIQDARWYSDDMDENKSKMYITFKTK